MRIYNILHIVKSDNRQIIIKCSLYNYLAFLLKNSIVILLSIKAHYRALYDISGHSIYYSLLLY
nr:MAG TPA: hypothetical protein [Caudoviricetes sp.]